MEESPFFRINAQCQCVKKMLKKVKICRPTPSLSLKREEEQERIHTPYPTPPGPPIPQESQSWSSSTLLSQSTETCSVISFSLSRRALGVKSLQYDEREQTLMRL